MSRKIDQKKARVVLGIVAAIMLIGLIHPWYIPSGSGQLYLSLFALLYGTLTAASLRLALILRGGARAIAVLVTIVTALVAGYDIFGVSLYSSLQF